MKNHRKKAFLYNLFGNMFIGLSTFGGVIGYEFFTHFKDFNFKNFKFFDPDKLAINWTCALPLLIGLSLGVFFILKRNKEFFKNYLTPSILMGVLILWSIYSIIGLFLFGSLGALTGAIFDDLIFKPLAKREKEFFKDEKEIKKEYEKEKVRIKAREDILV